MVAGGHRIIAGDALNFVVLLYSSAQLMDILS